MKKALCMPPVLPVFFCIFIVAGQLKAYNDTSIQELIAMMDLQNDDLAERGKQEIRAFIDSGEWRNGYYEGDVTDIHCMGTYGYMSNHKGLTAGPLYVCYQECLKPYVNSSKVVLEIGPGRGAWTKAIAQLNPKKIISVDALSADFNQFWQCVGRSENIEYHQIQDFSLDCVPNNSIDFVFSFGVFCRISPLMVYEYFKNMHTKLRVGAEGFIMYSDYDKKETFDKKYRPSSTFDERGNIKQDDIKAFQNAPIPCCWYHMGKDRMKNMLLDLGYEVINPDINVNERDPLVHFRKK